MKDTGDSIGRLTEYLARPGVQPDVYAGNNVIILPALTIGARGVVSALAAAVPELIVAVYETWRAGKPDEARELQLTVARLQACLAGMPYLGAVKHLVRRRGLPAGALRAPQPALTPEQAEEVDRRIKACEDLAPWTEPLGA